MIGDPLLIWLIGKVEIVIIKEIFVYAKKMNYCANEWLETCVFNARKAYLRRIDWFTKET